MLPPDIEENILTAIQTVLTYHMITLPTQQGDTLALNNLYLYPLQADPTKAAPYVVYTKMPSSIDSAMKWKTRRMKREEAEEYGDVEIGGPLRYISFYYAECGTPVRTTRSDCLNDINRLMHRLMQTLVSYYDLSGLVHMVNENGGQLSAPDLSEVIEGANSYLIDDMETHIYGGGTTWYGKGTLVWHYPVSWYPQDRIL